MEYVGFHGTSSLNESSIKKENFRVSSAANEWLGTGAYFFIDGVGNPQLHAKNWAKFRKSKRFVVLSVKVIVENVLHMDTNEGIEAFNHYRDYVISRMKKAGEKPDKSLIVNDCIVFNHMLQNAGFDAVINREFIKLDLWSRINKYGSRVPNCRVLSVKEPSASINVDQIEVVDRGIK
ncbi:hypothetical protein [Pantoea ananatis]|uniref:hypothetical protein n=1 Tax=Pantoea ananas TaxID=553 RepID=UPI000CEB3FE0|nr:hypothetical protein [Pantoea ananatis]AVG77945.1 hypothetical protein B9Q16_18740 [Pantoea ananatis]